MQLRDSIKHLTLRFLPGSMLQWLRKAHYARKLARAAEEPEMRVIRHLLPAGGTALDLGANFGLYARYLADMVGSTGQVHSVEPMPTTYAVLVANVRRLGLSRVTAHHAALSDRDGEVTMAVPVYAAGGANYYEARVVDGSATDGLRTVRVPARTLDGLFGALQRIDFIKCDVEGHELNVLRGAEGINQRHRPSWMIEVSGDLDWAGSTAEDVVRLMRKNGYAEYLLDGKRVRRRATGDRAVNYFFLRPEHIARLPLAMRS